MNGVDENARSDYREYLLDMLSQLVRIARDCGELRIVGALENILSQAPPQKAGRFSIERNGHYPGAVELNQLAALLLISAKVARALADRRVDERDRLYELASQTEKVSKEMRGIASRDFLPIG